MYTVTLSVCRNPDFSSDAYRTLPARAPREVPTLEAARVHCLRYIADNDLGGGNWTGGRVTDQTGKTVARISYNGRIWSPEPWPQCHEIAVA